MPVLGICYGEQLMALQLGGKVEPSNEREYGPAGSPSRENCGIFSPFTDGEEIGVWMSHGDKLTAAPDRLPRHRHEPQRAARRHRQPRAQDVRHSVSSRGRAHASAAPTSCVVLVRGGRARAELDARAPSWTKPSPKCREQVGPNERVICGLSGGVDSSVAAVLCHKALGDRLVCIFVDNGLLRQGEFESVVHTSCAKAST